MAPPSVQLVQASRYQPTRASSDDRGGPGFATLTDHRSWGQGYGEVMDGYAAVLLAGGAARRMAGVDKPAVPVGGQPMRDRVLAAVADAYPRIVVGPAERLPDGVLSAREDPPGSGPVAALAAGLDRLASASAQPRPVTPVAYPVVVVARPEAVIDPTAPHLTSPERSRPERSRPELVAVLAADLPLLTPAAVALLRRHCTGDGALFVDGDGRRQLLCGVWRVDALRDAAVRLTEARDGTLAGASMRALLAGLDVTEVSWTGTGPPPWFDCDTVEDVRRAQEWTR